MEAGRKQYSWVQWMVGVGDLLVVNALFFAVLRFTAGSSWAAGEPGELRKMLLILSFSYFFALYLVPIRLHASVVFLDKIVQRSFLLSAVLILFLSASLMFLRKEEGGEITLLPVAYCVVLPFGFTLWRVLVRICLKWYRRKGYNFKRVIIVGAGKNGMELYRVMKNDLSYGFNILGFFDDNLALRDALPNYLGMTHEVEAYALRHGVDEIYCTLPGTQDEKMLRMMNFAEKRLIRFYIVPELYRYVKKSLVLDIMESVPLLTLRREPLQAVHNRFLKRSFDILFSTLALMLYPFLYLMIGGLIKLSSPGPVIFGQKRTGIYGKPFYCRKFRTMWVNMEADNLQACRDDPRKTRIGDFLRRTNLDEYPQFLNVFLGEMSVVGPRPHMLKHTEQYSAIIDKYMVRHLVKPGVTGWAQVTGYRGETRTLEQMEGRVKRDVWYIENWSFFLDMKIIFVTILNMFNGERNAY
ncbi:MAG: undecaprenyl-phosphate glucose phosphotransferase [Tannerellaceae bacterium]|jgi:putative colanic acid biosynthesis UDP-glucose lipid carrier transferase|nr:undecaprenyl-phosphate glucose phosphotransferase [Tannerellaceae bacterium]